MVSMSVVMQTLVVAGAHTRASLMVWSSATMEMGSTAILKDQLHLDPGLKNTPAAMDLSLHKPLVKMVSVLEG